MTAIQLANWEQVHGRYEQTDPCGAADGRQEKRTGIDGGMHDGVEKPQQQWHAKGDVGMTEVRETWHEFRVKDSIKEGGDGKDEPHERTRGANIEKGAVGANRGANQDESAEGANERREGKEIGIAGANVVMAASEEVAEFMGEKNGEQREGERKA
jgi:hypothetical protein